MPNVKLGSSAAPPAVFPTVATVVIDAPESSTHMSNLYVALLPVDPYALTRISPLPSPFVCTLSNTLNNVVKALVVIVLVASVDPFMLLVPVYVWDSLAGKLFAMFSNTPPELISLRFVGALITSHPSGALMP